MQLIAALPTQAMQLIKIGIKTVLGPKVKRERAIWRRPSLAPKDDK